MKEIRRLFNHDLSRTVFLYGIILSALVSLLKFIEYRYLVYHFSLEVYLGIVAALCTGFGVWLGVRLLGSQKQTNSTSINKKKLEKLKISNREYEVLCLIAAGLSNQEIADQLFISLPTVKTHSSNLFDKLSVKRRTQAVQKAKELHLIA